jgi:hypothetical protein
VTVTTRAGGPPAAVTRGSKVSRHATVAVRQIKFKPTTSVRFPPGVAPRRLRTHIEFPLELGCEAGERGLSGCGQ